MLNISIDKISYSNKTILQNLDISIEKPGLYGFFGKNGVGKTTFFRALCGLVSHNGKITFNREVQKSNQIAWIPSELNMYEYLTSDEFMKFYSMISRENTKHTLSNIFEVENKLIKTCSTGTKKKIYINAVLQFDDYDIYIFDEPFNGLDIEANYILLNKIKELSETHIVLVSSHIIEIIEPFLSKSFIIANKTVKEVELSNTINSLLST